MLSAAIVVVAGPTASGKSDLALAVAEALNGVVINADSMQVYRELRVLTNRPGNAALARAPHHLFGVLSVREPCSVGLWRDIASAAIVAALDKGRLPIVVGGTGLYLRALLEGLAPIPKVPAPMLDAARMHLQRLGRAAFHEALAARDPDASKLPPDDPQRRQPDISKAKRVLDWEPKVELEDGLRETVEYFKTRIAAV